MTEDSAAWREALRVADLFALDPHGCGGVVLRAGAGPVRDAWLAALRARLPAGTPWRRCPAGIGDDRLLGGLDLAATLAAGRPVAQAGLMAEADGGVVVVPMAERMPPGTAARLAAALDTGAVGVEREGLGERRPARFGLVLLDEGAGDEAAPAALVERLAFRLDLTALRWGDVDESRRAVHGSGLPEADGRDASSGAVTRPSSGSRDVTHPAATALPGSGEALRGPLSQGERGPVEMPQSEERCAPPQAPWEREPEGPGDETVAALCTAADALGVASLRGPLLALRVARLAAARDGRGAPSELDTIEAARLVLAPRATRLPAEAPPEPAEAEASDPSSPDSTAPPETPGGDGDRAESQEDGERSLDDVVLEAACAAIPADLLAMLGERGVRPPRAKAGRAGAPAAASQGRPIGARPGDPRRGRLALLATLRAAAPWQAIRRADNPGAVRTIIVRPEDFRITRYRQRSESTTIFAVDASGSAALERLAEAKGAVELMLAEAYVRRDRVALVAFRGRGAELVLPPTRSLVRAKRGLAGLPGGGGTPLASGLDAAGAVALGVRRSGGTPVVVVLTDGRANVARSGEPGRAQAGADALAAARRFRESGVSAILIDTAARPQEPARTLAAAMGARYLPLPQADAGRLTAAVRAAGI